MNPTAQMELEPDHSARICPGASTDDLSIEAVERFRDMWRRASANSRLASLDRRQLLSDTELIDENGGVTYAALILLGEPRAVARHPA